MVSSSLNERCVDYSPTEKSLLALLPTGGKAISSEELVDRHYEGDDKPFNARQSIVTAMTNLIKKVEHNREPFRIVKAKRSGPYPMEYKKVKR